MRTGKRITLMTCFALTGAIAASGQLPPRPAGEAPTRVEVKLLINKIFEVETVEETYRVDGYLYLTWNDPSAVDFTQTTRNVIVYENDTAVQAMSGPIWWPIIEFINVIGEREIPNRELRVSRDGRVVYCERFHATFTSDMDFRLYPFDTQSFQIQIESFSYDNSQVVFAVPKGHTSVAWASPEWTILPHRPASVGKCATEENPCAYVTDELSSDDSDTPVYYSRFTSDILAEREPGYFVWQFFLPLLLIVASSWSVFWVRDLSNQLSIAFTLMLTVVAFNFFTSTLLPRLPYNTLIETVVILGYIAIFLSIVMILAGHFLERRGRETLVDRLFVTCRFVFPLAYAMSMALLLVDYFE